MEFNQLTKYNKYVAIINIEQMEIHAEMMAYGVRLTGRIVNRIFRLVLSFRSVRIKVFIHLPLLMYSISVKNEI